jgi:hypothetical protein
LLIDTDYSNTLSKGTSILLPIPSVGCQTDFELLKKPRANIVRDKRSVPRTPKNVISLINCVPKFHGAGSSLIGQYSASEEKT